MKLLPNDRGDQELFKTLSRMKIRPLFIDFERLVIFQLLIPTEMMWK